MELKFEVLASTSVKRKKPWPKFAWLSESEPPHGLYLLDRCRVSQVSPMTGKTRKKLPPLAQVQSDMALTAHSDNGDYLGGLTGHGDLFLWKKDMDEVKTFVSPLSRMSTKTLKDNKAFAFHRHRLFISNSGRQALLIASKSAIFLWELCEGGEGGVWWKIFPPEGVLLPDLDSNREAVVDAVFCVHPVFGDCCSCVFIFTALVNGQHHRTTITHLLISWSSPTTQFYSLHSPTSGNNGQSFPFAAVDSDETSIESNSAWDKGVRTNLSEVPESNQRLPTSNKNLPNVSEGMDSHKRSQVKLRHQRRTNATQFDAFMTPKQQPFNASWSTVFYSSTDPVKDSSNSAPSALPSRRGCYVCKLSPTGTIAALAINRKEASHTSVVFFSPLVDAGLSSPLYPSKTKDKSGRSYWIADMSWLADGLLLACMTKRGALVVLPRFGQPLKLITSGNSLEMGPAAFLPLHPLVIVTNTGVNRKVEGHPQDYSQSSEVDMLRQRFSVTAHPHHPVLVCSDGYSFSVLQLITNVPLSQLVRGLVLDARRKLHLSSPSHKRLPTSDGDSSTPGSTLLHDRRDVHDFAATLSDLGTTIDLDSTLGDSTLGSAVGGGPTAALFAGLDAGAVCFAGMESDLEQTMQSSLAGSTVSFSKKKRSLESAIVQLCAALGLLLSCGKLDSGNGVYPLVNPLRGSEVEKIQRQVKNASTLLLSTLLSMVESSVVASKINADSADCTTYRPDDLFHELFGEILRLVPLDSYNQSHLEWVTALINGVLLTVLKCSLTKHKAFSSLSQSDEISIQFLKSFADKVSEDISISSELLENAVSVLDATYSLQPLSSADSAFHTPLILSKKRRSKHRSDVATHLSVSLTTMLDVLGAFWQDIQSCGDLANKLVSGIGSRSSLRHNRLQLQELSVVCKGLAGSLQSAMATLKSSHSQIRRLIQGGKAKQTRTQLDGAHRSHDKGCQDQNSQVKGQKVQTPYIKGHQGQRLPVVHHQQDRDGNPITYTAKNNLSLLLSKLEVYDLQGALQVIFSDDILTHSSIPDQLFFNLNSSTTSTTNLSGMHLMSSLGSSSQRHLALASPSARPVVACLARVMMAYFSNQKLLIPPSTLTTTATTSSTIQDAHTRTSMTDHREIKRPRLIELQRREIVLAVRDQNLSKVWSTDCALELALLGGLWVEACDFVASVGEWRKAVLLSLTYVNHNNLLLPLLREKKVDESTGDFHSKRLTNFTHKLVFNSIALNLGLKVSGNEIISPTHKSGKGQSAMGSPQHCTEEMFAFVSSALQVCAAGKLDSVLVKFVTGLTQAMTTGCQGLPQMVHPCVYLPAPPLYCPQPSIPEEEYIQCPKEYSSRYAISHLVHSLVLLLRASNCLHSCAQWYCSELQKLTEAPGETREAFSVPENELKRLPQVMGNLASSYGQFTAGSDSHTSPVVKILLVSFRHLCSLLWLLHVRDHTSHYLRKLQPSLSKSERDPAMLRSAALWSCRLIPFADVLANGSRTPMDAQLRLTALSALSELPNDAFLANLLALYFPTATSSDGGVDSKLKRLMVRLRSAHDPASNQLLSVIYQSKSQEVLSQQSAVFGDSCGHFRPLFSLNEQKILEHDFQGNSIELCAQAFDIGTFVFEYDVEYHNFLDTLFAVTLQSESYRPSAPNLMLSTISPSSKNLLPNFSDQSDLSNLPLISENIHLIKGCDSNDTTAFCCWESLLPLLHVLKEWSELPRPQEQRRRLPPQSSGKRSKSGKGDVGGDGNDGGSGQVSAIRVRVPLELVVNCLKQREDELFAPQDAAVERREGDDPLEGGREGSTPSDHATSSQPAQTNSVDVSGLSSQACADSTLHVEDLENKGTVEKKKQLEEVEESTGHQSVPSRRAETHKPSPFLQNAQDSSSAIRSEGVTVGEFPLLQVPEGVLQGRLSKEQLALMVASPSQNKPHRTSQPGPSPRSEEGKEEVVDVENGTSLVVDVDVTETVSSGEFPSGISFSIGEVGPRKRTGDDTSTDETLLSTGPGYNVLSPPIHAATKQVSQSAATTIGGDGRGSEERKVVRSPQQKMNDFDPDRNSVRTSEPQSEMNNESSFTLTQSISSSTAVTLTEISQIELTQSPLKRDTHTVGAQNEQQGLAIESQHTAKSQCTTEADGEHLVSKNSTGNDVNQDTEGGARLDTVNKDGGGVKDGDLHKPPQTDVRVHTRIPSAGADSADGGVPESNQNVAIGDIVRSEMRKILELQHQQLLSLLGNAGSSTADASLAAKLQQQLQAPPTVQTPPIVQAPPTVKAPPPIAAQHQQQFTSDESLAPVLDVDDLRSLTPSDLSPSKQASHVTILVPPESHPEPPPSQPLPAQQFQGHSAGDPSEQVYGGHHHRPHTSTPSHPHQRPYSRQKSVRRDADVKLKFKCDSSEEEESDKKSDREDGKNGLASHGRKSTTKKIVRVDGGREKGRLESMRLSDLKTDSSSYSPGWVGPMTSSQTTQSRTDFDGRVYSKRKAAKKRLSFETKSRSSGFFTHAQQFNGHGSIQLLHLEPSGSAIDSTGGHHDGQKVQRQQRQNGQLEDEFPGLAKTLKEFNDSITPKFGRFARAPVPHTKDITLLQLPNMTERAPPLAPPLVRSVVTHTAPMQQRKPVQPPVAGMAGSAPWPLLIMPYEAYTPPVITTAPRSVDKPKVQSSSHTAAASAQPCDFKLPQIPIRPFVPLLLPPEVLGGGVGKSTSKDHAHSRREPQLLQLNDPLSKMMREGFELLRAEPQDEEMNEQKLTKVHVEQSPKHVQERRQEQSSGERSKSNLPQVMKGQPQMQPKMADVKKSDSHTSSASSSTTTVTVTSLTEESNEMAPREGETGKAVRAERRQRRKKKSVAWKSDHRKKEEPTDVDFTMTVEKGRSPDISANAKAESEAKHPSTTPSLSPSSMTTAVETKQPLRQPLIGLTGKGEREKKTVSYPSEISLQRLELRRLEMKSSFIPSSPQHQDSTQLKQQGPFSDQSHIPTHSDFPLTSHARGTEPQMSEIGVQVNSLLSASSREEEIVKNRGDGGVISDYSTTTAAARTTLAPASAVSTAVQVSPELMSEGDKETRLEIDRLKNATIAEDSLEVTSVSSLDSEEMEVRLSDSDDNDDGSGVGADDGPLTGTKENEFNPPPLWYNSRSPIPIPINETNGRETGSPISEDHEREDAPPHSSGYAGFRATPPPPLPLTPTELKSENTKSSHSDSPTPVPESSHQQASSIQTVLGDGGVSKPRPLRSEVIERLQQLEEQLSAIESTAKTVEGEFKATNKILFTIDRLQAVSDSITSVIRGGGDGEGGGAFGGKTPLDRDQTLVLPPSTPSPLPSSPPRGSMEAEDIAAPFSEEIDGECEYPGVGREDHPTDDSLIRLLNLEPVATTLHKQPPSPPSSQPLSMLQRLSATTSGAMEGEQVLQRQTEAKDTIDRVEKQQHEDACTKSREEGDSSIDNRHEAISGAMDSTLQRRNGERRQREDLRSWMTAKRKERLAQFVAERDRLRKSEKRPFQPTPNSMTGETLRKGASSQKRDLKKDFVAKRIKDAYALMNDILSSKPSPSHAPSSSSLHSNALNTTTKRPPRGSGRGQGCNQWGQVWQKGRLASGGPKKVGFSTSSKQMTRSKSDSKLYREESLLPGSDTFGGSMSSLQATYTTTPTSSPGHHGDENLGVGGYRSSNVAHSVGPNCTQDSLLSDNSRRTMSSLNNKGPTRTSTIRKISSVEGLTEDEQDKIAAILASTECDVLSVSSGSVVSNIDWEEVDRILDS